MSLTVLSFILIHLIYYLLLDVVLQRGTELQLKDLLPLHIRMYKECRFVIITVVGVVPEMCEGKRGEACKVRHSSTSSQNLPN